MVILDRSNKAKLVFYMLTDYFLKKNHSLIGFGSNIILFLRTSCFENRL